MVAIAEEDRFNRKKHAKPARVDNPDELPINALQYCLEKAGILLEEVDSVGYSLNPEVRLRRNTQHQHPYDVTRSDFGTKKGEEIFYQKNREVRESHAKIFIGWQDEEHDQQQHLREVELEESMQRFYLFNTTQDVKYL